jgi:small subunit ribosomal protein S6
MRTYETVFIVHPDNAGDAYAASVEKFRKILSDQGANILKVEEWGTRKLAYQVKKQGRGTYVLMAYEAAPKVIAEFERRLRLDEAIIKFQTVHLEKGLEAAPPAKEATPPAREAAEAEGEAGEGTETERAEEA